MPENTQAPPSDANAEAGVISAVLVDSDCVPNVMINITSDEFYIPQNRLIFEAMTRLYNEGMPIDPVTLIDRLKEMRVLDKAGGIPRINDLMDFVVSGSNVMYHVDIVKKKHSLRLILEEARLIQQGVYNDKNPEDLSESASKIVRSIIGTQKDAAVNLNAIINESLQEFVAYMDGKVASKIKVGWNRHDRITGGFGPGQLIIVGARPAMGKSQYVINLARKLGCAGIPVYIKSYEMSKLEIADRFVNMNSAGAASFTHEKNKDRSEIDTESVLDTYGRAHSQLKATSIIIDEIASDDTTKLRSRLLQEKAKNGLGAVIIDYLQLIAKTKEQQSSQDPMGEISRNLKMLAKELGVPVIALSQLNREASKRTDKRPKLEDLRQSGAIEQDADMVILLHRDDYYQEESDSRGIMEIIFAKNRHGSTGLLKVFYDRINGLMAEVDEWGNGG